MAPAATPPVVEVGENAVAGPAIRRRAVRKARGQGGRLEVAQGVLVACVAAVHRQWVVAGDAVRLPARMHCSALFQFHALFGPQKKGHVEQGDIFIHLLGCRVM